MSPSGERSRIASLGARWIRRQRTRLRPLGRPLEAPERERLAPYFEADTLDRVRIVEAAHLGLRRGFGVRLGLAVGGMRGITFDDAVLLRLPAIARVPAGLLFHELVHVVQFELLGVEEFVRQYLGGWTASGFRYRHIPLERTAYGLQAAFEQSLLEERVNEILRRRLHEDRT